MQGASLTELDFPTTQALQTDSHGSSANPVEAPPVAVGYPAPLLQPES